MKLNPLAWAATAIVLLTGCAVVETGRQTWFKEGATDREQEAALAAAEAQAAQAHPATRAEERDIVIRNMTAQGWRLVSKDTAPPLKTETARPLPPPVKPGPTVL